MNTNIHLAYFVLFIVFLAGFLTFLAVRSGSGYSVEDTRAHAEQFVPGIAEGHGGITAFIWVTCGGLLVWSVVYLVMHWQQFAVVFFR